MITLLRGQDRRLVRLGESDVWHSFVPQTHADSPAEYFGLLAAFDEIRLCPGEAGPAVPQAEAEVVTYMYRGSLAQESSKGRSTVLNTGEFQRMTISVGSCHREANASVSEPTRFFSLSLYPSEAGLGDDCQQQRFPKGQRHSRLCVVASPDGRRGSLRLLQDAVVYSSVLDPGRHVVHELLPGRSAWLHLVCGEATLPSMVMSGGDGAGFVKEPAVAFTSTANTEVLLVDLGPVPRSMATGVVP